MSDNELPALPSAVSNDGLSSLDGLEHVDWQSVPESDDQVEAVEAVSRAAWMERMRSATDQSDVTVTICTVELRDIVNSAELSESALQGIASEMGRCHELGAGVALEESRLLLALPEGVSWVAIATTIERAVVVQGMAATQVHAGFGLADSGAYGQTLDDAVRLSGKAAVQAYEGNLGASVMTLTDEVLEGRDEVVARALEEALDNEVGLRLVFQPKIDTGTQEFVGAEALMRFQCDELGEVGPAEFFPIAARKGLLARLEQWVIGNAIPAIAQLASDHGLSVPVSINVRGADLLQEGFVETIGALLEQHKLNPDLLRVEVTEADVLARLDAAEERLGALRAIGVGVALDDFGKQGATLADLRRLPIDVVKVHRAFTRDMETDATSSALIQGVMSLSRALGIQTVAVGVESWGQFETLRSYGCSAVQGFLFSPPLEANEFMTRLDGQAAFHSQATAS